MTTRYLLPSAIDYVRIIHANVTNNLLAAQPSYAALPSLYQRAYAVVHGTGAVKLQEGFAAPAVRAAPSNVKDTLAQRR